MDAADLHSRLNSTRRRFARAAELTTRHLAGAPDSYVSWSGGKDSTVVAHLAHLAQPGVPIIRFSSGVDYPETAPYCDTLAAQHGWNYHVAVTATPDAYLARVSAADETDNSSYLADATAALGYEPAGWLYGLRGDESATRGALLYSRRGTWTGRHTVTAPLWDWSTADVHAYHAAHNLPLHPVYGRLTQLGCPHDLQRVGFLVGGAGARTGRYRWLKAGWPTEWERLARAVPWLRDVS